MGITAVAVGMAVCQFVLLLAGQFFLLRRLIGVPMRESLAEGAPALVCSASSCSPCCRWRTFCAARWSRCRSRVLIGSLGLALYAVCLRVVSPAAWGDLRTLFVRVLGARRLLPLVRNAPQRV